MALASIQHEPHIIRPGGGLMDFRRALEGVCRYGGGKIKWADELGGEPLDPLIEGVCACCERRVSLSVALVRAEYD